MAIATITEITTSDIPGVECYGTPLRRIIVHIRCPSSSNDKEIALGSYIPGVADVEGIVSETDTNAAEGTASTWGTTTYTVSSGAAGAYEGCIICTMT